MKRKELETLQTIVKAILENDSMARNSDDYLYSIVCRRLVPDCANAPFCHVISNRKRWNLPSYESVGRTRRKLQEKFPELSAFDSVKDNRTLQEAEYIAYARG